jgi:hypothetical protein
MKQQNRAGLQLSEVGKFFLLFKHSSLSTKTVDDIKLQIGGDYNKFAEARALALRLSPNRNDDTTEIFHAAEDDDYYDNWYEYPEEDPWWNY